MKAGTNHTGEYIYELMIERLVEKKGIEKEKTDAARREWEKILNDANEFLRQDKHESW